VAPRITFSESSTPLGALLVDLRMMHSGDADVAALSDYQKRLVPSPLATPFGTKRSRCAKVRTARPVMMPDLLGLPLESSQAVIYDTPVGLRQLHVDPRTR